MARIENFASHWYDGFRTEDLLMMLPDAKDRAEFTADPIERELWKLKVVSMEDELLRRQTRLDELEM